MLQIVLQKARGFYLQRNRWWLPLLCGLAMGLCFPPFDPGTHPLLFPLPFLSLIVLIPLFAAASNPSGKRWVLHAYLWGMSASLSQYYWIVNDTAEGVWHLIILGTVLLCLLFGAYYLAMGAVFRLTRRVLPRGYVVVFPALWVISEYIRTLGELSFPWTLMGYSIGSPLSLAQTAAWWGVYGLSFVAVLGNTLVWWVGTQVMRDREGLRVWLPPFGFAVGLVVCGLWGMERLESSVDPNIDKDERASFSCVQANIDQRHWGTRSLDTAFAVAESLAYEAGKESPDCIVMAESALLCYLVRRPLLRSRVEQWVDSTGVPMVVGALHWDRAPEESGHKYLVYNTAFLVDTGAAPFRPYYKMKLVPFSEVIPFEGLFPILSRVNLGEADFSRGTAPTVFRVGERIKGVPLVCYEVIYPNFVRTRVQAGANVLLNITNDGWFGRSSGPFHHAAMARMRCIENGISMVRCANSGVSMLVDPLGRVVARTGLYERTILAGRVPLWRLRTLYFRWGDWAVWVSIAGVVAAAVVVVVARLRRTD